MKTAALDARLNVRLIQTHDGRHLGVSEYGIESGDPVVFCHDFPGSRLGAAFLAAAAERGGARLIAVDRPGIGLSTPRKGRRVVDWASDVECAVDELGLREFSVLGSGRGSPYAFAVAARLPERVAALAATRAPLRAKDEARGRGWFSRYASWLGNRFPFLHALPLSLYQQALRADPKEGLARLLEGLPSEDRRLLIDDETRALLLADVREAFRQGLGGPFDDAIALEGDWGFSPGGVRCPVQIWKGGDDSAADGSPSAALGFAHGLAHASLHRLKGEGPIGALLRDGSEILRRLALSR